MPFGLLLPEGGGKGGVSATDIPWHTGMCKSVQWCGFRA